MLPALKLHRFLSSKPEEAHYLVYQLISPMRENDMRSLSRHIGDNWWQYQGQGGRIRPNLESCARLSISPLFLYS